MRAPANEGLSKQMSAGGFGYKCEAPEDAFLTGELPSAPPEDARGRLPEPHRIMIQDAPRSEDDGEGIQRERRIEILKLARSNHNGRHQQRSKERGPGSSAHPFRPVRCVG